MEEKEKKKSNGKLIIAIVLIVATIIIAGLYLGIFSLPTGLVVGAQTDGNPTTTNNQPTPAAPAYTATGTTMLENEVTKTLPYYESVELEPGKYGIEVATDKPVWVMVYSQTHFDEWESSGIHGTAMTSTGYGKEEYKTKDFSDVFSVGYDGKGKYYIVIEGNDETSIKIKLVQVLKY